MYVFLNEILPILGQYKNSAFKEENEVRLIYCDDMMFEKIVDSYGAFEKKLGLDNLDRYFRVISGNDITEFVKLNFDPSCIKDVCIGPKCLLTENDVIKIAGKTLGRKIGARLSECSYR